MASLQKKKPFGTFIFKSALWSLLLYKYISNYTFDFWLFISPLWPTLPCVASLNNVLAGINLLSKCAWTY